MRQVFVSVIGVTSLWLGLAQGVRAHQGPPFPIVVDHRAGSHVVSIWTDPDIGIGKFFVIFEPGSQGIGADEIEVRVCVQPTSGRLEEACFSSTQEKLRDRVQYYSEVDFDQQEMWRVRVVVKDSEGTHEILSEVEATPPGFGAWDLLLYGFPFLLFGILWVCVALRRRHDSTGETTGSPSASGDEERVPGGAAIGPPVP